jgi:hypothetical protein
MSAFSLKQTMGRGIALALPLAIVVYVIYRFIKIFEKILGPVAKKMGVDSILGEITITFFAVLTLLVIAFLLGLLMRIPIVFELRKHVEGWILKFIPSLNHLKLMAAEKLNLENAVTQWKPVLYLKADQYVPAYLIEENADWITLASVKTPGTEPGSIMIFRKTTVTYQEISMKQMAEFNKGFGKGYLTLLK